jgi:y4mF family transcriptional regulator
MLLFYCTGLFMGEKGLNDKIVPSGKIETPRELGHMIRKKRKQVGADQVTAAGLVGVGVRFLSELERGKPTVELGKVLQVVQRLGLEIWVVPKGSLPGKPFRKSRESRNQ